MATSDNKKNERRDIDENTKNEDLEQFRESSDGEYLTSEQGVRINHTDDSLKAGGRGPTIMEDFHFREKMTHFDHERIPERVVHARGSAAHGFFQPYENAAKFSKAGFLQDPSQKTPLFLRISTVVGSRGSADTVRDVRGFATKFYTEEGNFDLVGNNMPVFFIQDAIKFPDLVHSIKPEPDNEVPQASAAHDTFWDFASLTPETTHMLMWVLSDRALPRSLRMMEAFGVHTFRLIDADGKSRFVKFHWKPILGIHSLVWDETQKLAGKDPDFNRKDLWEAIENEDYPEFELGIQVVEEEDEHSFDFDILDATKIIPEEEVPVTPIGKMTLNRNPDNFFAETEQVAFHVGNVVPGIDFTNDPLLQGRLFSYLDTQLTRLGGPNFAELPINRPVADVHNNQRDGFGRQKINKGKGSYLPNSVRSGCPMHAPENMGGYVHHTEKVDGHKIRERSDSFKDHFSQATLFWNSMSKPEKDHIVKAAHFELGKVKDKEIRKRVIYELFNHVDHDFAVRVAKGVGIDPPSDEPVKNHGKKSPALSMENTVKDSIKTRKIALLALEGYNHSHVSQVKDALMKEGAQVKIISERGDPIQNGKDEVEVDMTFITTGSIMFDAVFIPGGKESVEALKENGNAVHFVNEAYKHCKPIAAVAEGVSFLKVCRLPGVTLPGPGSDEVTNVKGIVAGNSDNLESFTKEFIRAIAQHRHWDREDIDKVPA
ncbi:catalase [Rhodohalobacter sp. SW132]|uniref:catalase n=1 Tax=Rhodohalobacter sp. SW132 TaxID=2293433 RepID=UPI000E21DC2E|nr:catalase [Rhodohalobacter sp. SW132]REL37987.1 catalase [Rhodohalobacter sp. SW132]